MKNPVKRIRTSQAVVAVVSSGESMLEYDVVGDTKLELVLLCSNLKDTNVTVRVKLGGKGAQAKIIGVIIGRGTSRTAMHTLQLHSAPGTTSDLMVKSLLSDRSKFLYDGGIRVEKNAQKTDAYQRNENLILSEHAYAESKPSLEILADDVRCTHGATAGPVDDEQVWYLATRGIDKKTGEHIIARGFVESTVDRIEDPKAKEHILDYLARIV